MTPVPEVRGERGDLVTPAGRRRAGDVFTIMARDRRPGGWFRRLLRLIDGIASMGSATALDGPRYEIRVYLRIGRFKRIAAVHSIEGGDEFYKNRAAMEEDLAADHAAAFAEKYLSVTSPVLRQLE